MRTAIMVTNEDSVCFLLICRMQPKSPNHSNINGAMLTFRCLTSRSIIFSIPRCASNFFWANTGSDPDEPEYPMALHGRQDASHRRRTIRQVNMCLRG